MERKDIVDKILETNPDFDRENITIRLDGRIEYGCEHGVGHTIYSPNGDYLHGCEGCCDKYTILYPEDLNSQE